MATIGLEVPAVADKPVRSDQPIMFHCTELQEQVCLRYLNHHYFRCTSRRETVQYTGRRTVGHIYGDRTLLKITPRF